MEFVLIQIGKNGFSDELVENIKSHLKKKKKVKLKLLNNFLDSKDISRKEAFELAKSKLESFKLKLVGKIIFIEN